MDAQAKVKSASSVRLFEKVGVNVELSSESNSDNNEEENRILVAMLEEGEYFIQ